MRQRSVQPPSAGVIARMEQHSNERDSAVFLRLMRRHCNAVIQSAEEGVGGGGGEGGYLSLKSLLRCQFGLVYMRYNPVFRCTSQVTTLRNIIEICENISARCRTYVTLYTCFIIFHLY